MSNRGRGAVWIDGEEGWMKKRDDLVIVLIVMGYNCRLTKPAVDGWLNAALKVFFQAF